jgi:hypothetical protein
VVTCSNKTKDGGGGGGGGGNSLHKRDRRTVAGYFNDKRQSRRRKMTECRMSNELQKSGYASSNISECLWAPPQTIMPADVARPNNLTREMRKEVLSVFNQRLKAIALYPI